MATIPRVERVSKSALLRRWQWGTVLMLLVIGTINYLDRSTLPHPTKSQRRIVGLPSRDHDFVGAPGRSATR